MSDNYNYRVVRHKVKGVPAPFYGIRLVVPKPDGTYDICCEDEVPAATCIDDLGVMVGRMNEAMKKPVIDEETRREM